MASGTEWRTSGKRWLGREGGGGKEAGEEEEEEGGE